MKRNLLILIAMMMTTTSFSQYKPAGDKIKTDWASEVVPENVLPEYPRPLMVRPTWKNLNGLWQYAITPKGEKTPTAYEGDILCRFALSLRFQACKRLSVRIVHCGMKRLLPFRMNGKTTVSCYILALSTG